MVESHTQQYPNSTSRTIPNHYTASDRESSVPGFNSSTQTRGLEGSSQGPPNFVEQINIKYVQVHVFM